MWQTPLLIAYKKNQNLVDDAVVPHLISCHCEFNICASKHKTQNQPKNILINKRFRN